MKLFLYEREKQFNQLVNETNRFLVQMQKNGRLFFLCKQKKKKFCWNLKENAFMKNLHFLIIWSMAWITLDQNFGQELWVRPFSAL